MFNFPVFFFAYVLQSDRFGPSIYNTINPLLKRMAGHPTDFKSEAHNSFSCQQQTRHRLCVNESRTYSAVRLFLILCEMQTIPYCIYMDNLCSTYNWTVSLQIQVCQQNYAKLCNGCYSNVAFWTIMGSAIGSPLEHTAVNLSYNTMSSCQSTRFLEYRHPD